MMEQMYKLKRNAGDKRSKYLNTTRINRCGKSMTMTDFNGMDDVTVQFDNGFIIRHAKLWQFRGGYLKCCPACESCHYQERRVKPAIGNKANRKTKA